MPGGTHSSQHQKSPIYRTLKSDPSGDEKELLFPFSIAPSGNPARKLIRKREREADLFCGWAATLLGVFGLGRGAGSPSPPPPPQQQPQKPPSPPPKKKTFIPDPSCFRAGLDLALAAEATFPFPLAGARRRQGLVPKLRFSRGAARGGGQSQTFRTWASTKALHVRTPFPCPLSRTY